MTGREKIAQQVRQLRAEAELMREYMQASLVLADALEAIAAKRSDEQCDAATADLHATPAN